MGCENIEMLAFLCQPDLKLVRYSSGTISKKKKYKELLWSLIQNLVLKTDDFFTQMIKFGHAFNYGFFKPNERRVFY